MLGLWGVGVLGSLGVGFSSSADQGLLGFGACFSEVLARKGPAPKTQLLGMIWRCRVVFSWSKGFVEDRGGGGGGGGCFSAS